MKLSLKITPRLANNLTLWVSWPYDDRISNRIWLSKKKTKCLKAKKMVIKGSRQIILNGETKELMVNAYSPKWRWLAG